jgi:hypothetical protein
LNKKFLVADFIDPTPTFGNLIKQNISPVKIIMEESTIILETIEPKKNLGKTAYPLVIATVLNGPVLEIPLREFIETIDIGTIFRDDTIPIVERRIDKKIMKREMD